MAEATPSPGVFDRLLKDRIIWLGSEVRDDNANEIAAKLLLLAAEDAKKDIYLYVNSPGGSITAGMAIYDTMQFVPNDIVTVGIGMAASMGQLLLTAGTKGKRYITPNARVLLHQPHGGFGGTASDIQTQAQLILDMKKRLAEITAAQTGKSVEQINADGDRDRWFNAQEALEYGFVDHIRESALDVAGGGGTDRRSTERRENERMNIPAIGGTAFNGIQAPGSRYILPSFEERTAYGYKRQDPYAKLFEDRIIFLGVQVDDASADDIMAQLLVLESHGSRPRHHPLHQLARRLVHGHDGDLRHDAVHPSADPDRRARPGGLGRGGHRGGGHARQAPRAAERARAHPPAGDGRGRPRPGVRHRDPGGRDHAHARVARGDAVASLEPHARSRSTPTSTATRSSRPRSPSSTGSSTRCSPRARACRRSPGSGTPPERGG